MSKVWFNSCQINFTFIEKLLTNNSLNHAKMGVV
jgi:hypothetical protein